MSAKDNFAQAMKELLNNSEEGSGTENEEKKAAPSSFSSFKQPEARPPRAPAPEKKDSEPMGGDSAEKEENDAKQNETEEETDEEVKGFAAAPAPASVPFASSTTPAAAFPAPAPAPAPVGSGGSSAAPQLTPNTPISSDTTMIALGTKIVGDISTASGLQMNGDVKGNLKVATKMELNGKVIGDIEADNAVITTSQVKGNVSVKHTLDMDKESIIIGDVSAKNVRINGKIKGNLTVDERGHFEPDFILVGNLISGTVIIDEGAMLKGDIAITNAQTENITVDEPVFDIEI